jgi:hypothetical protein
MPSLTWRTNVLDNQYGFGAKRKYHICVDLLVL